MCIYVHIYILEVHVIDYLIACSRPPSLRVYFSTPEKKERMSRASSNPVLRRTPLEPKVRGTSPAEPRRVRPGELNH